VSVLTISYPAEHVIWAEINRPESGNAINFEVMDALDDLSQKIAEDESIRVFILSGVGNKFFASGGDIKEFSVLKTEADAAKMSKKMGRILERIETADCWTIACVNGDAYGGGCETMLAFDFRIAVKHARFGFTQTRFYLPPGWGGLTRLVERVGKSTALLWLGKRELVDTENALISGLIDSVQSSDSLRNQVLETARKLSANDRRMIKALKKGAFEAERLPHKDSIKMERITFARFWADAEHHRRVTEFLKRKG
jgi:enoyl-CoA hydratase